MSFDALCVPMLTLRMSKKSSSFMLLLVCHYWKFTIHRLIANFLTYNCHGSLQVDVGKVLVSWSFNPSCSYLTSNSWKQCCIAFNNIHDFRHTVVYCFGNIIYGLASNITTTVRSYLFGTGQIVSIDVKAIVLDVIVSQRHSWYFLIEHQNFS